MLTLPSGIKHYGYDIAWSPPWKNPSYSPENKKVLVKFFLERGKEHLTWLLKLNLNSIVSSIWKSYFSPLRRTLVHHTTSSKACDGLLVSKLLDPIFFFLGGVRTWSGISCLRKQHITFQGTKHFPLFLQNNN